MYKKMDHHELLLNYLQEHTYRTLSPHLWNHHLWLYKDLIKLLSIPFIKPAARSTNIQFYTLMAFDDITGIAVIKETNSEIYIDISTSTSMGVMPLINAHSSKEKTIKITCDQEEIAKHIAMETSQDITLGNCYYSYQHDSISHYHTRVREITLEDTQRYENIDYLGPILTMLTYYGYFSDGDVVSSIGIAPLSPFHAELIGLTTYKDLHRRKGYGKAVAQVAVENALKSYAIITWTTQLTNLASHRTAIRLGFQPYLSKYHISLQ